jgi:hypothetical protein
MENSTHTLDRRHFLKIIGLLAGAAALVSIPSPLQAKFAGRRFKATSEGQLLVSENEGDTWEPIFDFGPECRITGLFESRGELQAELRFRGHRFYLHSADGAVWYNT